MFTQVAVVPFDRDEVSLDVLLPIAAAIQVQVQRDLGPAWGVQAAVSAFASLEQVPQGTWPVAVTRRPDLPVDGFHFVMNGLPFGIVGNVENLSVVLSHEIAEMLVDPFGQHTVTGPPLTDNGQGPVDYLVEVCDPCEGDTTYQIGGVAVADFVVPAYYHADDMTRVRSRGYSFTGALSTPRQVRTGGYITWRLQFPSTTVFQAFALRDDQFSSDVRALTADGDLESVCNPGFDPNSQATNQQFPARLQVLQLPNSPTRAWRELIAALARELPRQDQSKAANRGGLFADSFRGNIDVLLKAMENEQPPPSLPEILSAIENPDAKKTLGQTLLPDPQPTDAPDRRDKIISYLKQQESLSGFFGPDLDSRLAMWMFVIMP